MKIFRIGRKLMPANSMVNLSAGILNVEVSWLNKDKRISRSYDLAKVIKAYGEDHGCVALCWSPKFPDDLIWHETTRFSCSERIASDRSYTSVMETGPSLKDTLNTKGRHNAASPSWVLRQRLDATSFLYVLTPSRGCAVEDAILIFHDVENDPETPLNNKTRHRLVVDKKSFVPPALESLKMFLETWLVIEINGPEKAAPDTLVEISATGQSGGEIYIDASAGILNRSRAKSGQRILLDTRGLETGDEIVIKTGYKFWPGISQKKIVIT
jgi:hypothetical protein